MLGQQAEQAFASLVIDHACLHDFLRLLLRSLPQLFMTLRYAARLSTAEKQVNDQSINLVIISKTITKLIGDRLTLIGGCFLLETRLYRLACSPLHNHKKRYRRRHDHCHFSRSRRCHRPQRATRQLAHPQRLG
jgi:hypothetical protein